MHHEFESQADSGAVARAGAAFVAARPRCDSSVFSPEMVATVLVARGRSVDRIGFQRVMPGPAGA